MASHHVDRLTIQSYGCIKDLTLALTPLHALVGPNDSGKSTILRALRTVMQFAGGQFDADLRRPFAPMFDRARQASTIRVGYGDSYSYELSAKSAGFSESVRAGNNVLTSAPRDPVVPPTMLARDDPQPVDFFAERLRPATMIRLDPNALRAPTAALRAGEPIAFASETGGGLASILNAINTREVDRFLSIREATKALFPQLAALRVPTDIAGSGVTVALLQADLVTGEKAVPAAALSEGLLYYLAFACMPYLAPASVFLVEEPENGLHPARIAEVVRILREISKTTQVVLATHSPLVINELEGDEVSIITRTPAEGTKAILLNDTFNYATRRKIMANGEIWLSYSDGVQERVLVEGPERVK